MNYLKPILAVLAGIIIGSIVNMAIVSLGPMIVPLPEGADVSSMESLRDSMHLMKPANYVPPFLGHALGTLVGAFVAAKLAPFHPKRFALGIVAASMLGGSAIFNALDLLLAYLPMGWLGGRLAGEKPGSSNP